MKEGMIKMIGKMLTLNDPSFRTFLSSQKIKSVSNIILLTVGVGYGLISIASNATYIMSFESALLQNVIVPLIFILFGLIMAFITKIGLALLLWAGARGVGGKGFLSEIYKVTPVALIPGLLGVPYLSGVGNGSGFVILLLLVGVVWMYLISSKIIHTTQSFSGKKAYVAALFSYLFLASVYYLIIPTST